MDLDSLFGAPPPVHHGDPTCAFEFDLPRLAREGRADARSVDASERVVAALVSSKETHELMAHHVWQSAVSLSECLVAPAEARRSEAMDVRGKTVVELGAGAALPSLVAAKCGARRVVATDFPDERMVGNMRRNVAENKCGAVVSVVGLKWGESLADVHAALGAPFPDLVMMADTLWMAKAHDALLATCDALVGPRTKLVVAFLHHDVDGSTASSFLTRLEALGFHKDWATTIDWVGRGEDAKVDTRVEYGDVNLFVYSRSGVGR